ncbi:MAG: MDR family MFS transporter [Candidatus Velthaea sp.]
MAVLPTNATPRVPRVTTTSLAAAAPKARRAEPPVFLITLTTMLGLIMAIIDNSIVNVALNNMAGTLGASIDEIGWVATGYILANVVIMPLNGWLTARFGRRNFYAGCVVIFTLASLLCGTATNVWQLVFYRIIQGLGGGALQPTAQAILFESYPPEKRSGAMAIFGLGAMVGPAIGPTLGGVIVDNFSWPLIFFINIPIGIVAFMMTLAYIRDPAYIKRDDSRIDWVGLGMMTAGIAALQYVLERGQHDDWFSSPTIVVMSAVAVFGLIAFVIRELRDPKPLVDLSVFKSRGFTAGNIIGIVSGFGLFGLNLVLPLFFQNVLHFDATMTGIALLPGAIATALSMPIAGRFAKWLDARASIAFGLGLFAVGAWMMGGLNADAGLGDIFWPRVLQGFALGFLFVPLTTATLADVPRARMSNATGLYTLLRQLGGGLGIAILQLIEVRKEDSAYAALAAGVTPANPAVAALLHATHGAQQQLQMLAGMVRQNATVLAYDDVFRLCGVIFAISVPTVFLLSGKKPAGEAPVIAE